MLRAGPCPRWDNCIAPAARFFLPPPPFWFSFAVKELGLGSGKKSSGRKKILRRFRRPLPFCFAVLALLVFLGGVLYPPSNYTGLNYRLARVLQWLAHGQWCWIHTPNFRMNDRACGFEWLTTPLLLFTRSDRALFLINFIPFLLLPGLVFSVFTRLGVRPRVAWHWMWLLPTGYNFLLQAGGIANDIFPAVYALAALDFGCRAWVSRRPADLWHSLLAAALLTGAKASNLPLAAAVGDFDFRAAPDFAPPARDDGAGDFPGGAGFISADGDFERALPDG